VQGKGELPTAQEHQLTLVTRNIKDFEDCGVPLFNAFREP
jgi:hypothetical protein